MLGGTGERVSYVFDPEPSVRLAVPSRSPTQMLLTLLAAIYLVASASDFWRHAAGRNMSEQSCHLVKEFLLTCYRCEWPAPGSTCETE